MVLVMAGCRSKENRGGKQPWAQLTTDPADRRKVRRTQLPSILSRMRRSHKATASQRDQAHQTASEKNKDENTRKPAQGQHGSEVGQQKKRKVRRAQLHNNLSIMRRNEVIKPAETRETKRTRQHQRKPETKTQSDQSRDNTIQRSDNEQ